MKILFLNAQNFEISAFKNTLLANSDISTKISIEFSNIKLTEMTLSLCQGYDALICFVNDDLSESIIRKLKSYHIKAIFLRSAGYNHAHIKTAQELKIPVYRVPAYSPEAVAEHSIALLMTLNRKTHKAYARVKEMNFSLDGLVGYNLKNKTVGIIGTGKIGRSFAQIISGFGSKILLNDISPDQAFAGSLKAEYVSKEKILSESDILSFHCPLTPETHHFINSTNIFSLKKNAILLNTSRGAIIESKALITALKKKHIAGAALDVYEFESELFFADHSCEILEDDLISRLTTFPNVLITAHQGFLTEEALREIALTTIENIADYLNYDLQSKSENLVTNLAH